jgi:Icc-related predicted phosphoesterase
LIRIAAVGDLHVAADNCASWRDRLSGVNADADALLLAGDLTRAGTRDEAESLRRALGAVDIPMLAVLGNHDYHHDFEHAVIGAVERSGGRVLEGDAAVVEVGALRVGVAGTKGFGGGFVGACGSDFGEPEMKVFIRHTRSLANALRTALASLQTDVRVALLHYAPVPDTLEGERCEIYPFLGSYLLAEAIDTAGADLVVHGHAHAGTEKGLTAGGVRVRNVAEPVIRSAYRVYCFEQSAPGERAEQPNCA